MTINVRAAKYCEYYVTEIKSSIHQPTIHSLTSLRKGQQAHTPWYIYYLRYCILLYCSSQTYYVHVYECAVCFYVILMVTNKLRNKINYSYFLLFNVAENIQFLTAVIASLELRSTVSNVGDKECCVLIPHHAVLILNCREIICTNPNTCFSLA